MKEELEKFVYLHREWKKRYNYYVRKGYLPLPDTSELWAQGRKINVLYGIECSYTAILKAYKNLN